MIGELSYFLGLQIKQLKNDTFVSQCKYIKDMLKKFGMKDAKGISTPIGTNGSLDSDSSGNMVDQTMYRYMIGSERIKMPKRGGELGFSKKLNARNKSYKPEFTPSVYLCS
jgi:hypothetical protein